MYTNESISTRPGSLLLPDLGEANYHQNVGRIALGVAHDLNNLLTVTLGRIELVMDYELPRAQYRCLEVAKQSILDAARVVDRMRADRFVKHVPYGEAIDLGRMVCEVVEYCQGLRQQALDLQGIRVEVATHLGSPGQICGDRAELRMALTNIVLNAMDALISKGCGYLSVCTDEADRMARIVVHDTGVGIPEDVLDWIFEPYVSTKGEKGTGLGLTLAKEIVETAGGSIEVCSKVDEGSTFTILLPLVR